MLQIRKMFADSVCTVFVVMGQKMFEVRCSNPKIGVRVQLPKDEHVQGPFDVRSTVRQTFIEHQTTIKMQFSMKFQ